MNVLPVGDRGREHPHRDHRREVERRDPGDDAERLADLVDVDAGRDLLAEAALEEVRDAARELEVLDPAGDLAEGVRRDLAVLGGQVRRELLAARLDEVPDLEQDVGPLRERRRAPGREGRLRRGDGGADLIGRGEVDLAGDPAGRRVVDRARGDRTCPRRSRPPIQWWTAPTAAAASAWARALPGSATCVMLRSTFRSSRARDTDADHNLSAMPVGRPARAPVGGGTSRPAPVRSTDARFDTAQPDLYAQRTCCKRLHHTPQGPVLAGHGSPAIVPIAPASPANSPPRSRPRSHVMSSRPPVGASPRSSSRAPASAAGWPPVDRRPGVDRHRADPLEQRGHPGPPLRRRPP